LASAQARHRSRIRYPARRDTPECRRSCSTPDHLPEPVMARRAAARPVTHNDDTGLAAMVIVLRNRRVNRISRLVTSPCAAGISAIPCSAARCAAFTSRSSRTLNCPSNLIGHDHPNNRPENGTRMIRQSVGGLAIRSCALPIKGARSDAKPVSTFADRALG
jgi:hypothetical protein